MVNQIAIENEYRKVLEKMSDLSSYSEFGNYIQGYYHALGHNEIGQACSTQRPHDGVMTFSIASARDPIFYRWHLHLEDLMRAHRDKHKSRYDHLMSSTQYSIILDTQKMILI